MIKSNFSLRQNFLVKTLSVLLIIALLAGGIQLYFMNQQINLETDNQAKLLSQGIQQGIAETDLASNGIEHQIDLKMISYCKHIADLLKGRTLDEISQDDLTGIRDELGLAGITLFTQRDNDIIGVKATDAEEVGFSFKKFGYMQVGQELLQGRKVTVEGATYSEENLLVLPIAQSGSHQDKPSFFKYAYYHIPGSSYIINPYINADEVYQFTNSVGPDAWIDKMKKANPYLEEIAVLNPKVFADPSLATKIYPPLKKVVFGNYTYTDPQDTDVLKKMLTGPKETTSIQRQNGHRVFKMFLPIDNGQVIYLALNYDKLSQPIYHLSIILIISGLVSLLALFMLTVRFFNRIYENIQRIKTQIKLLETRDFTVRSEVKDGGELRELSDSTNRMVETLQAVLKDTGEQAKKTQRLSVMLEADTGKSVEQMYTISMEETTNGRAAADEFMYFLDQMEEQLLKGAKDTNDKQTVEQIEKIRASVKERAAATTDMTLTLSDLLKSLHQQSSQLSEIANSMFQNIARFKV